MTQRQKAERRRKLPDRERRLPPDVSQTTQGAECDET